MEKEIIENFHNSIHDNVFEVILFCVVDLVMLICDFSVSNPCSTVLYLDGDWNLDLSKLARSVSVVELLSVLLIRGFSICGFDYSRIEKVTKKQKPRITRETY